MSDLIPLRDRNRIESVGIPHPVSVLRKWFTISRHPGLVVKIGGSLFVDLAVWRSMIEAGRQDAINRAEKVAHAMRPIEVV